MRFLILLPLAVLASCSPPKEEAPLLKPGVYFGGGRDAACVIGDAAPQRFAFIAFAEQGDTNCAAEGRIERDGQAWAFVPKGEGPCRIPVTASGDVLAFGKAPAACAYYCGPGAAVKGQRFQWKDSSAMLLDQNPLAHDGVC